MSENETKLEFDAATIAAAGIVNASAAPVDDVRVEINALKAQLDFVANQLIALDLSLIELRDICRPFFNANLEGRFGNVGE